MGVTWFLLVFHFILLKTVSGHMRSIWEVRHPAIDPSVVKNALDSEVCAQQLQHITSSDNTLLRLRFIDAGLRLPKSILELNNLDMGNYDQCLGINEEIDSSVIEGKYCMLEIPAADDNIARLADTLKWDEYDPELFSKANLREWRRMEELKSKQVAITPIPSNMRSQPGDNDLGLFLRMALCIPKACTTDEGITGLYIVNVTALGLNYRTEFCRVKGDKPWAPVDYVAVIVLCIIGFITILSTAYDIWWQFIAKKDPKAISTILRSFSVYTNGKRLTTFTPSPNNLSCIDGIRSISMFWILAGHTHMTMPPMINNRYIFEYIDSIRSLWISAAGYSVDTFFFLGGLLVVYTTVGKMNGKKLISNLHLFYLNRLLRMFPLLAAIVLLQSSLFNQSSDGPLWTDEATITDFCRRHWWLTLLYVQNYIAYNEQCVIHSWYLAIDMQCYIVCPLILYFLLNGNKKAAWISLTCGLLAALTMGTTYSFIYQFPGWVRIDTRGWGPNDFHFYYYFNTITRASAFCVGMIFGYLLNTWKGRKFEMSKPLAVFIWCCSGTLAFLLMYITHVMRDENWDTRIVDDFVNSFARPLWCLTVGWVIFACQHGYGGPVNWFLTLDMWKLTSRISYAMYLFHYKIQWVIQGSARTLIIFTELGAIYEFFAQAVISFGIAFGMTLVIDSPFSVLFTLLLGKGPKKPKKEVTDKE